MKMLGDRIRAIRKDKNMSQTALAERLHVVRQTVSKWEQGNSVPDAEMLVRLAQVLETPVNELLGIEDGGQEEMARQLQALSQELEEHKEREQRTIKAQKIRVKILFVAALGFVVQAAMGGNMLGMLCFLVCIIASLAILYRNMSLLTFRADEDVSALKTVTVFNIFYIIGCILISGFLQRIGERMPLRWIEYIVAAMILILIVFYGVISPRIPFNRHTGIKLPWTVFDAEAWAVAHQMLGTVYLPIAVVYVLVIPFATGKAFGILTLSVMAAYIGIPAIGSLRCYLKKFRGK